MSRRRWLGWLAGAAAPGAMAATGLYSYFVEPHWLAVRRHTVRLARLPAALDGFRVAHISDLHYHEQVVPVSYLERAVALVNAQRPDAVAVTGDLVSNEVQRYGQAAARLLSGLRAPHGVFVVLGNHDYAVYGSSHDMAARRARGEAAGELMARALRAGGMTLLRNQAHVIERDGARLTGVGLDDLWAGRFDPTTAFAGCGTDGLRLVLLHNPDGVDQLPPISESLVLSGHTHGGQVRLPLLGHMRLSVDNEAYAYGMISVSPSQQMYVTSGVGYNRRARLGVRPEVAVFTLRRA